MFSKLDPNPNLLMVIKPSTKVTLGLSLIPIYNRYDVGVSGDTSKLLPARSLIKTNQVRSILSHISFSFVK
jgi:hypothetical protein